MTRKISAYLLIILGLLTVTFFRVAAREIIPYPIVFWIAGLLMVLGGRILLLFDTPKVKAAQEKDKMKKMIEELKFHGEKIRVDFAKCEVKSNDYQEEQNVYEDGNSYFASDVAHDIEMWNVLLGDGDKNVERVDVYQSVIIFKNERFGKAERFISRIIAHERITLLFKLDAKKFTTLYVDANDRSRYYFDLDFLEN